MKAGPNIALPASLVGDPARANMLSALMSGRALTATELAGEAGITAQTASSHLAKLESGGLVTVQKQGRHRYYALSGEDVAQVIEGLMGLAARTGHVRTRTGPKEPALRSARVCYDHLAGEHGVQLFESLKDRELLHVASSEITLRPAAVAFFHGLDIDVTELGKQRRPLCKACLDWSVRRSHLAGGLGAAMLQRFYDLKWARRIAGTRVVEFSPRGEREFAKLFGRASAS